MSDHFSGPAVMGDPSVDITDFYAFSSPEREGWLTFVVDIFPMANEESLFSDAVDYRVRVRGAGVEGGVITAGEAEYGLTARFGLADSGPQSCRVVSTTGAEVEFAVGGSAGNDSIRAFAGLRSDPFFMDVFAALKTDQSGQLAFDSPGTNLAEQFDCLAIVVEVPAADVLGALGATGLLAVMSETVVTPGAKPIRIDRVGRPEIKNVILSGTRDDSFPGVEVRDLYNREDAFSSESPYRPLYESRMDCQLAFFDGLDGDTAWPLDESGRHPLRDLLLNDYLVLDAGRGFEPGTFLEIEKAALAGRPHTGAGGRWLDDDIVDEVFTWYVSAGKERVGDGVDGPTQLASLTFPYLRDPNLVKEPPALALLSGGAPA